MKCNKIITQMKYEQQQHQIQYLLKWVEMDARDDSRW